MSDKKEELKKESDTSITVSKAAEHFKNAPARKRLGCSKNRGLSLIKLQSGCAWRYRYTDLLGKRREATIGKYPAMTPREAAYEAKEQDTKIRYGGDTLAEKQQKQVEKRREQAKTVESFLDGYYTTLQSRKKNEGKHTLNIIRSNFDTLLNRQMASITEADIHAWQSKREQEGRKRPTLVRAYSAFKTMLRTAHTKGFIENMPLENVSLEKAHADENVVDTVTRRVLSPVELSALQRALELYNEELKQKRRNSRQRGKSHLPDLDQKHYAHWFIPFCYCALHLGMRSGDLYTLDWSHINLKFKRLVKIAEKTRHHNEPSKLDLPLNDTIAEILTNWHSDIGKPTSGLVFTSPVTGGKIDRLSHRKSWDNVKKLAGEEFDQCLVFYSLRHHFISALVSANVPLFSVAKLAGHKSTKMIEQHYAHLAPSAAANAMEALGRSLTQSVKQDEAKAI